MKPHIMKFGGASVANERSIQSIANIILERLKEHPYLVVVVSAMGDTTNRLMELAKRVNPNPPKRELDMLVSVGERVSISLLAMALSALQVEAISFTGSQSGIITNDTHSDALIVDVRPKRISEVLSKGRVAIVAGFQGVSRNGEITTLGRGGSDTTAVALAVSFGCPSVEFYKDVGAIFEKDPKVDPKAKRLPQLTYIEALQLTGLGARVLHGRSIALAEKNGIQMKIYSIEPTPPFEPGSVVGWNAIRNPEQIYEQDEHANNRY